MVKPSSPTEMRRDGVVAGLVALSLLVLAPRPGSARLDADLTQATEAVRSGMPASALDALERALAFEPALAALHIPAARLALEIGSLERATAHLDAAKRLRISTAGGQCLDIEVALRRGTSPSSEVSDPSRCLDRPGRQSAWTAALLQAGDLDRAIETLRVWVDQHPEDLSAWEDLSGLILAKDPAQARSVILRALQHHPVGSPLLDGLLPLAPDQAEDLSPETLAQAGELFAAGAKWGLAAAIWQQVLAVQPDFPQALAYLGLARLRLGEDGLGLIELSASQAPDDPIVRGLHGQALLSQAEIEGALRELRAARDLDPRNPAIAAAYAGALVRSGDYQSAAEEFLDAAEVAPAEPAFWLLLADFSLENGYEPGTLGLFASRNAAALNAGDPPALAALGYAWHLAGDSRMAERLLRRSLEGNPIDPRTWYRYGLVLLDLDRPTEASAALEVVTALDPDGDLGRLAGRALESVKAVTP